MHKKKLSLKAIGIRLLKRMFHRGKGTSKHHDKRKFHGKPAPDKIYTYQTLRRYSYAWCKFVDFVGMLPVRPNTCEETLVFLQPYIDFLTMDGYSAWTVWSYAAGVAKVLQVCLGDYSLPERRRRDVKKGRQSINDIVNADNCDCLVFCMTTGLRKGKELRRARGNDLVIREDGSCMFHVPQGKGGLSRDVPITATGEDVQRIIALCQERGEELLFPHVPSNVNVHACRAIYACRVYRAHARPIEEIPKKERYYCRRDMAGVVLDRKAMMKASQALGHSRICVIAQSYLWPMYDPNSDNVYYKKQRIQRTVKNRCSLDFLVSAVKLVRCVEKIIIFCRKMWKF